jgi:cellulose/xylan binding protein with CBM9 domain
MRRSALLLLVLPVFPACIEQETPAPTAGDLELARRDILPAEPKPRFVVNAELEDKVVYLGMDVEPDHATPGKALKLTHYWKVKKPVGEDWKLFVHLGPQQGAYVNADHAPLHGRYPVAYWKAGEILRDQHSVTLPARWPAGDVEVYVGIWKGSQRLKVAKGPSDGQGRVLAAKIPLSGGAAQPPRPRYVARRANGPIKIDGKLDEPAWQQAPFTDAFVNTLTGAKVEALTQAKILWDDASLYVAFSTDDKDVASSFTKQDDKLWTQDAVELFIDADGDGKDYVELEASPAGVIFDSYLPGHRQNQDDWKSGMRSATQVNGTLNKHGDVDRGFTTEIIVPLAAARGRATKDLKLPPAPGTVWRINLFRMDLDQGKPQQATAWSAPLVGDFHTLDRFGDLVFGDAAGAVPAAPQAKTAVRVAPAAAPRAIRIPSAHVAVPVPPKK